MADAKFDLLVIGAGPGATPARCERRSWVCRRRAWIGARRPEGPVFMWGVFRRRRCCMRRECFTRLGRRVGLG